MTLDELNRSASADQAFLRCCGSTRWARAMSAARPFASATALTDAADTIWDGLAPADWREAFAAHPRIGDRTSDVWAGGEQAGAANASSDVSRRLAEANRAYEARFGYIFIVCASGKTAEEMLAIVERRMANDADRELRAAADEQRQITRLRLAKLLASA
jgi:OHCU decarboxylase